MYITSSMPGLLGTRDALEKMKVAYASTSIPFVVHPKLDSGALLQAEILIRCIPERAF